MMSPTITDRLLALQIVVQACPQHGWDDSFREAERVLAWAERLALAEQQFNPAPIEPSIEARIAALEANSHKPIDLTPAIVEILNNLGIKPPALEPAEPPRADWIEGARKAAHEELQRVGYIGHTARLDAALDAFIAAMPPDETEALRELIIEAALAAAPEPQP